MTTLLSSNLRHGGNEDLLPALRIEYRGAEHLAVELAKHKMTSGTSPA